MLKYEYSEPKKTEKRWRDRKETTEKFAQIHTAVDDRKVKVNVFHLLNRTVCTMPMHRNMYIS